MSIKVGTADEKNSQGWGDYTSMTVDPVDDCKFGTRFLPDRAERIANRTDIRRAQFKPVARVDLDGIEKLAADELGAGNQCLR